MHARAIGNPAHGTRMATHRADAKRPLPWQAPRQMQQEPVSCIDHCSGCNNMYIRGACQGTGLGASALWVAILLFLKCTSDNAEGMPKALGLPSYPSRGNAYPFFFWWVAMRVPCAKLLIAPACMAIPIQASLPSYLILGRAITELLNLLGCLGARVPRCLLLGWIGRRA